MSDKDVRWILRFSNFQKALKKLGAAVDILNMSELEREGLIQRFEYTYELAWKTMQDIIKVNDPSFSGGAGTVLEMAAAKGYIEDLDDWKELKSSREMTSHTYDESTAESIADKIVDEYYDLFTQLETRLQLEKLNWSHNE
jgi:nucleotidyltransferase substrate binding protein (TIGR01987 family)